MIKKEGYRKDIDGIRAVAVLSVVLFHFGLVPNGYLGVDSFFVISGFLITGIIYKKTLSNSFSIKDFYIRRIRRILPLVLLVTIVALLIGVAVMLPDDLENLAQSVVATNFFGNNILALITTKNYWDVVNEFKPLMHTWSLGIEEQFYFLYPLIFMIVARFNVKWILPVLILLTVTSIGLYLSDFNEFQKFYLLPFRFFELSIGGIVAILLQGKRLKHKLQPLLILLLILLISLDLNMLSVNVKVILATFLTVLILASDNSKNKLSKLFLENRVATVLGVLSFSIYMWHQIILAFTRYFVVQEPGIISLCIVLIVTFILSYISYKLVEVPFRFNFKLRNVLVTLVGGFLLTTVSSLYLYSVAGVVRDIPELNIKKGEQSRNMHSNYNHKIYELDKPFGNAHKYRVLVIGNSFARDWCNVLLESSMKDSIHISYVFDPKISNHFNETKKKADFIFLSERDTNSLNEFNLDRSKTWCVGTKNFGISNGYFYNNSGEAFCSQRTKMESGFLDINTRLKEQWSTSYIDLIEAAIDKSERVPVFTDDCKFISQDCRHFTKDGAVYYAQLLNNRIQEIIK